jgi:hypothetical protein
MEDKYIGSQQSENGKTGQLVIFILIASIFCTVLFMAICAKICPKSIRDRFKSNVHNSVKDIVKNPRKMQMAVEQNIIAVGTKYKEKSENQKAIEYTSKVLVGKRIGDEEMNTNLNAVIKDNYATDF